MTTLMIGKFNKSDKPTLTLIKCKDLEKQKTTYVYKELYKAFNINLFSI